MALAEAAGEKLRKTPAKGAKTRTQKDAKTQIVQTALTWGHVITISVLALAAVMNIGGFFAIVFKPETAERLTAFAASWQTFYIAGILGYDAKSTIENTLKITKSVSAMREAENDSTGGSNG